MTCPADMEYQECGDPCQPSCANLEGKKGKKCKSADKCEEGCFCKEGKVWDGHSACIDPEQCGCEYEGAYYPVRSEIRSYYNIQLPSICTCVRIKYNCRNYL